MIRDSDKYNENLKPNSEFLIRLKEKLPEFFKDDKFDLDKFKNMLKEKNINELKDGYQLDFIGKDYARRQSGEVPTSVIVPDGDQNKGEGKNSKNLFFTGDNLEVLRHLQHAYYKSIDIVYVDPPYNTGKKDFIYPDNFEYSDEKMKSMFGMNDSQLNRLKSIQGKSNHSAWLTFMYPRMYLVKKILKDDGVIFISIDDNELSNLILLMNEIFGESNFIENYIWESNFRPDNSSNLNRKNAEFILMYSKNKEKIQALKGTVKKSNGMPSLTKNSMEKSTLHFKKNMVKTYLNDGIYKKGLKSSGYYLSNDIEVKNGIIVSDFKLTGHLFWGQKYLEEQIKDGNEIFIKSSGMVPYANKKDTTCAPNKIIPKEKNGKAIVGDVLTGRTEVNNLFKVDSIFKYPKPTSLIKYLVRTVGKRKATVLDMFAGSATTADALMQLNLNSNNQFKYIMIQLDEKTYKLRNGREEPTEGGKTAYKAGFKSIDEISRTRIKNASLKIQKENELTIPENFDGSFKHYRVVKPVKKTLEQIEDFDPNSVNLFNNMLDSFSSINLNLPGKTTGEQTILNTWLLKDGYPININIKKIDINGYMAYLVENTHLYLISSGWNSDTTKELLNLIGNYIIDVKNIVLFGYSFNIAELRELEIGLKQLDKNINLVKRY